jgi:hypothetical protein
VFWLWKTEMNCWTIRYCARCVDVAANIIVFKFDGVYGLVWHLGVSVTAEGMHKMDQFYP